MTNKGKKENYTSIFEWNNYNIHNFGVQLDNFAWSGSVQNPGIGCDITSDKHTIKYVQYRKWLLKKMKNDTCTKVNPNILDIKLIWKRVLYICSYWFTLHSTC